MNFIAAGTTPSSVANFTASSETKDRVADLIAKEKTASLDANEKAELDHFLEVEHIMRLAKAKARQIDNQ
ncbi:hypothetical protein N9L06_00795 [Mariniblastus sp.]|nr:hypothetical protein [Mariniblastus sp.]